MVDLSAGSSCGGLGRVRALSALPSGFVLENGKRSHRNPPKTSAENTTEISV